MQSHHASLQSAVVDVVAPAAAAEYPLAALGKVLLVGKEFALWVCLPNFTAFMSEWVSEGGKIVALVSEVSDCGRN